ncbi:uncharacterized protein VTP21DRAFT_3092 [Calcarisporiella thermophila]|uniref:uncharacterized protein n=1 Tax=Calcarisporiella thermophila TaxID=911321 RepID=UPI00374465E2
MWFRKQKPPPPPPAESQPLPKRNFLSDLVFHWATPLLKVGYKRPLQKEDLYVLNTTQQAEYLSNRLRENWAKETRKTKPSLVRALWATFSSILIVAGILRVVSDVLTVIAPLMIQEIIAVVSQSSSSNPPPEWKGYVFAVALFLIQELMSLTLQHSFQIGMSGGISVRTAVITTIYRKALVLSGKARQEFTNGKITNLMSTDAARLDMAAGYLHNLISAPVEIVVALILLIRYLGPSALAGLAVLVAFGPLQGQIMKVLAKFRKKATTVTDSRIKLTQEVLSGMRVIKFYGWEKNFLDRLGILRRRELHYVRQLLMVRAGVAGVTMMVPTLATIVTFIIYTVIGNELTPEVVFPSLALFNMIRIPLIMLPMVIAAVADAKVSLGRIQEMLLSPELDTLPPIVADAKYAVRVTDGEFVWESPPENPPESKSEKKKKKKLAKKQAKALGEAAADSREKKPEEVDTMDKEEHSEGSTTELAETDSNENTLKEKNEQNDFVLRNVQLNIPRGQLVAVVGAVGSGKSSLLNALVGEMRKTRGEIEFGGTVGYCPQTPFIQNASVRGNITFGLPFDQEKYQRVVDACALTPDLKILPDGDQTEIGERGVNISGGQKQRVNIARAVYFDSDIVLLDDPLSAVDSHVGRHLFEKCILEALSGKTRILVTHQLHFLPRVDYIIVMDDGEVREEGTYADLMKADGEFALLMKNYGGVEDEDEEAEKEAKESEQAAQLEATEEAAVEVAAIKDGDTKKEVAIQKAARLMTEEERFTGNVDKRVYIAYMKSAGAYTLSLVFVSLILSQASNIMTSVWLSFWSGNRFELQGPVYMGVYAGLGGAQALLSFVNGIFFAMATALAAERLHSATLNNVLRAPMAFFDTTPLGRIINRFSKDVDAIDNLLGESYRMFLQTLFLVFSIFVLIATIFPVFLAPIVPLLGIYYIAGSFYTATSRELKRLQSILRSSLYANFSETLSGLPTIRAFRVQQRCIGDNERFSDLENMAYYLTITIQRWLGLRLELLGNTIVFLVAIFSVAYRYNVSSSIVGLLLSYSLQTTNTFGWCVRQLAEVETNMNAVERLFHYAYNLEQEAPDVIPDNRPPENWPARGEIQIENMQLRYREGLPVVLNDINVHIHGGEKIAVVGRTGSGKSSIMVGLFRIVELCGGRIMIDGVDVSKIGLNDLRTKLAIIPQDPVLFHGTFRSNVDPFGRYTDLEIWDALARSDLKNYVSSQPGGLEAPIAEGGENLSVGQRQLICLARALLTKAKIIVLDEATASVDLQTDALIQRALREDFKDSTVLTIAHRLNTIIDYDRVLVLEAGKVKEFDTPAKLLEDPEGAFTQMVENTGPTNAALLRNMVKN